MKSGSSLDRSPRRAVYLWLEDSQNQHTTATVEKTNITAEKNRPIGYILQSDSGQKTALDSKPWAHTVLKTVCVGVCDACHPSLSSKQLQKDCARCEAVGTQQAGGCVRWRPQCLSSIASVEGAPQGVNKI
ncbi:uncharacterized protein LOC142777365 [Rhipicephalus microplus]|uniref:uncharacterized protein LOC142777365 n=1 Tax=Rhipicephalus microplus TaxID=6941 RepID=UPI003F6D42C4